MTRIGARIARLEQSRPAPGADVLELDMPPDLCARIDAAKAAGTFPQSLSDDDVMTVIHAADVARGRA